jgi:hypothetical protein
MRFTAEQLAVWNAGNGCPWAPEYVGLTIPEFLLMTQEERKVAWAGYKTVAEHSAAFPSDHDRSEELLRRRREISKELARERIAKMKEGLAKKEVAASDQAALKAGKKWNPRRARWE